MVSFTSKLTEGKLRSQDHTLSFLTKAGFPALKKLVLSRFFRGMRFVASVETSIFRLVNVPQNRRNYGDSLAILYPNGYLARNSATQRLQEKVQFHLLSVIFFAVEDVRTKLVVCLAPLGNYR